MGTKANRWLVALITVAAMLPGPGAAWAGTELVMFEAPGCVWCARWNREISAIYPRTPEGAAAPLRRVDLAGGAAAEAWLAKPVRYTPTFVLHDDGHEVGRITGYANDAAFWGLLGAMLARMSPPKVTPVTAPVAVGIRP